MRITAEQFAHDIASAMIADILELWTVEEIRQLIEDMEAKARKLD